jgi:hypothetical protein
MNRDEANVIIRMAAATYPNVDVTEDMVDMWANAFWDNDPHIVKNSVEQWILTETWFPTIAAVRSIMRQTAQGQRAIAPRGSRCDGTGWIENSDRASHPCPQCNPALFGVFSDPDKLRKYRDGIPLSSLTDDVIPMNGTQQYVGTFPSTCLRSDRPDEQDPEVTPAEGRATAAMAYEAECKLDGREPNWDWFNKAMGLYGPAKKAGTR